MVGSPERTKGTLARLRALRCDLIDRTIAAQYGRIVNPTGDGSLIAFRSVVDREAYAGPSAGNISAAVPFDGRLGLRQYRRPAEQEHFVDGVRASRLIFRARGRQRKIDGRCDTRADELFFE
jgi:class 3 adenylate cyclase